MKTQQFSDKENLSPEQDKTREEIEKPKLNPELLKQLHSLDQHPQRLPIFIALYLAAALALYVLVQAIATPWVYILCLPLYLLAAASLGMKNK